MKLKYFTSVSAEEKPCFDISEDLGGGSFGYIGEVFEEENAAFIVKACNNHYQLLEALKTIVSHIHFDRGHDCETVMDGGWSVYDKAEEAIKQAEVLK